MVPAVVSGDIEVRYVAHSIRRVLNPLGVVVLCSLISV